MLQFDHMTVIAPSLEEGIEYVGGCLGIEMINGTSHKDMGTHNRRVRLGEDCYLEVIAINFHAPVPQGPRWFGLDGTDAIRSDWTLGSRLKGWVARTDDMDSLLSTYGEYFGSKRWLDNDFHFSVPTDGALPMGGVLPSLIDVGQQPLTATGLVDQSVRLSEFVLEHPDPSAIIALYREIGIARPPEVIKGERIRFSAVIDTPGGMKVLQ